MSAKNWFKFVLLGLIWGSSFFWIKLALREMGPFTLVFYRVFFAVLGLVGVFLVTRRKLNLKFWWVYLFLGFFNVALPFVLISWSEKHITSGVAAILNSTQPLFTIIFASLLIEEEHFTLKRVLGILIGFSGVFVLMSNRLGGNSVHPLLGILTMLIAVSGYGISAVFARKSHPTITPEELSLGQMAAGLFLIVPAMLIIESPFHLPALPITYLAVGWLGLMGSCVAALLWYGMLRDIGPTRASMTTYMFPLVGVVLGAVILGEIIDWRLLVGGIMILCAIVIVNSNWNIRFRTPAKIETLEEGKQNE